GMILQPLVENAIKHGLKDCMKDGVIEIIVSGDEQQANLVVSDNGSGMDSDELEEFILNDYQKENENHLGLYNVVKRLQMYYQDAVTISINSNSDCGFEIMINIRLPKH
ncbi:MAG: ATP-binding protein, partial [Longicatena sp.]